MNNTPNRPHRARRDPDSFTEQRDRVPQTNRPQSAVSSISPAPNGGEKQTLSRPASVSSPENKPTGSFSALFQSVSSKTDAVEQAERVEIPKARIPSPKSEPSVKTQSEKAVSSPASPQTDPDADQPTGIFTISSEAKKVPSPRKEETDEKKETDWDLLDFERTRFEENRKKADHAESGQLSRPRIAPRKPDPEIGIDFEYTYVDQGQSSEEIPTEDEDESTEEDSADEEEGGSGVKNLLIGLTKSVFYIAFVGAISVFAALFIIRVANDVFAFVKPSEEVPITIGEAMTVEEIAETLGEKQVIDYPFFFRLFAKVKKDDGKFVAGDYTVTSSMNYSELLSAFKEKAPVQEEVRVTIPEGYTVDDIINLFLDKGMGTREGFVKAVNEADYDYWFLTELGEVSPNRKYRLEGYLYPDTYYFYKDWEETKILNKILANFDTKFTKEYRDACAELGYTVDEILNYASIIQMEAKYSDEYAAVSSVLHNRINSTTFDGLLNCDATIQYIFAERKKELLTEDTRIDSPYNTYLYRGLPPGPITNPVMSAVDAALFPDKTNYYYFVAQANGRLLFAVTEREHLINREVAAASY